MSTESILFEVDEASRVATLTLNRPQVLNSFDRDMIVAWRAALQRVETDPEIRALVVTGACDAFCAGGCYRPLGTLYDCAGL